jgi:hypothetical protein
MKTISCYEVKILKDTSYENSFEVKSFDVIAENEREAVVEKAGRFTILDKKETSYGMNPVIGVKSISEWKLGLSSTDGIHYTLYSYRFKPASKVRAEIETFIKEKYSYLFSVNLDFIK